MFRVVPVEVDSYVSVAFPVGFHQVVTTDGFFKMYGIGFVDVFYSEVIDDQSEGDGSCLVNKESSSVLGWKICGLGENLLEFFV